jgi:hypothetical protein
MQHDRVLKNGTMNQHENISKMAVKPGGIWLSWAASSVNQQICSR